MAMTVQQIIEGRKTALLQQWAQNPLVQVQVESPSVLGQLVYLDDATPGQATQLGRFGTGNVAVVTPAGGVDPHRSSLWVRSQDYQGYGAAYRRFLSEMYGVTLPAGAIAGFQVDHLLNRARSPSGGTFVRVEAVVDRVNHAWGILFERAASHPDFHANQVRERRTMSWPIAAKVAGLLPPTGPDDRLGIDRIAAGLTRYGLNKDEATRGMQDMLNFAFRVAR